MRPLLRTIKPTSGIAHVLHLALVLVLPAAVFILVRLNFVQLALAMIVLSKWRMFAVRPRFWAANLRANAIDLMVGLSIVVFMNHTGSMLFEAGWALVYAVWLLAIKPGTTVPMITAQAFLGQLAALSALYLTWADGPVYGLTFLTGLFCFLAARHFLDTFEEPYAKMLAFVWGYFGAALAWLLSHWLLFYGGVAQPTLLLSTLGYGLAVLYYLDHNDRLSKGVRRQFIFIMLAIVLVVLAFSDWGDKVV
ncbi:hypothetical protein COY17_01130 [Candidatus Saccharibacteria bacterium CG_4_10_14_0_2_um_filter_52_9]|nr:MAG: hypothetical protein COY17_01130 [Candidatus Saccharibacteria bacterium CG_4_10_14_0_2_um_filter_52_9]